MASQSQLKNTTNLDTVNDFLAHIGFLKLYHSVVPIVSDIHYPTVALCHFFLEVLTQIVNLCALANVPVF